MTFEPHSKKCPRCNKEFIQSKTSQWCCIPCRKALSKQEYENKKRAQRIKIRLHSPVIMEYDPDNLYSKGADFDVHTIPGQLGCKGMTLCRESFSPGTIVLSGGVKRYIYDGKLWQAINE